jgi:hypothetical protein
VITSSAISWAAYPRDELKQGSVLGVDRKYPGARFPSGGLEEGPGHDDAFLVSESEVLAARQCGERGPEAAGSGGAVYYDVRFASRDELVETGWTGHPNIASRAFRAAQAEDCLGEARGRLAKPDFVSMRGEADDLEHVGLGFDHVQGLRADGACSPYDDDSLSHNIFPWPSETA